MASAKDLLHSKKSAGVITTMPDCSVLDACRLMRDRRIGSLVVSEDGRLRGIITERDVVNRVVAEGLDPAATMVESVMTEHVIAVRPDRSIEEIEGIMRQERIRHVVVAAESGVVGMISIGDVTAWHAAQDHQTVEYLTEYISGRA
jgi:CBS domain-containing protein